MAKIGYARVSSPRPGDQDYDTQVERLKAAGCEIVRAEKVSGKDLEGRDELASISGVHPGQG
jgi:DNA invertase Pin-like site-specific DNA recombinase